MNISKKLFITVIVAFFTTIIVLAFADSVVAKAKEKQTDIESAIDLTCEYCYPTVGVVTKVKKGIVYISEAGGNVYSIYGSKKDYHKGDVIAMLIYSNGTWNDETDDEIIKSINYGKVR